MRIIRYSIGFILFFILFYWEGLPNEGTLSMRQLWKIPLIIFLIYHLLFINTQKQPIFCKVNNGVSLMNFFNPEYFVNLIFCISEFTKQIIFSLFFSYFSYTYAGKDKKIKTILLRLAQFIALSSIPVLTGIIEPPKDYRSLGLFGTEGNYYSGIFGAYHVAGYYFCISFLILVFFIREKLITNRWSIYFNLFLSLIALYSLFLTFVRTGWIMCLIGLIFLFIPQKKELKKIVTLITIIIILFTSLVFFYNTNQAFRARVSGQNIYREGSTAVVDTKGSGRNMFWENGIELWGEGNIPQLLFGRGYTQVVERNEKKTGMRVFSHNLFIDTLSQNGLIGLSLLLLFYYTLYNYIRQRKESFYYPLCMTGYISMFMFGIFQGNFPFLIAVLIPLMLLLLNEDYQQNYE